MDIKRVLASAPSRPRPGRCPSAAHAVGRGVDPKPCAASTRAAICPRPLHIPQRLVGLCFRSHGAHRTVRPPDAFDGRILVPFSPESLLSGVGRQLQPDELLWYVRRVSVPAMGEGERCLLHFEAVDFACACCVNGQVVGTHEGGYLPFSFDITEALRAEKTTGEGSAEARFQGAESMTGDVAVEGVGDAEGDACGEGKADLEEAADLAPAPPREFVVALCVRDPSDAGTQPRGKQRLKSGGIWYTAQSGIWQPVWMEVVPARRVLALALHPDADAGILTADVDVSGRRGPVRIYVCDPTGRQVGAGAAFAEEGSVPVVG